MIAIETSAVLAILVGKEEAPLFRDRLDKAGVALVSAGTAIELAAVSSRNVRLFDKALAFLREPYIRVEAVDAEMVAVATEAYRRYGKGHHPAGLNLGDVFSYALARSRDLPLLFKGNDFVKTDVDPALSVS